jgi:hypothetical protein
MFKIESNNKMSITRGDDASFDVDLENSDGTPYEMETGDILTFTVKTSTTTPKVLFQKTSDDGSFKIEHDDTASLQYGDYRYDIQFTKNSGDIDTVITPSAFVVLEEVTW